VVTPSALQPPVVDERFLAEVVRRLPGARRPLKIVLFGSHARGDARPDSDLDLLIIEPAPPSARSRHRATRKAESSMTLKGPDDIEPVRP